MPCRAGSLQPVRENIRIRPPEKGQHGQLLGIDLLNFFPVRPALFERQTLFNGLDSCMLIVE
jgi:hypothetical protein